MDLVAFGEFAPLSLLLPVRPDVPLAGRPNLARTAESFGPFRADRRAEMQVARAHHRKLQAGRQADSTPDVRVFEDLFVILKLAANSPST